MRCYIYILIGGLIIFCSCSRSNNKLYSRYDNFPVTTQLEAKVIKLDTVLFQYPFRVKIQDNLAVVLDLHNRDYYFHAFTYPNWEYVVSFGRRGEGPEEMLSAESFQFDSTHTLYALDANKMQLSHWNISIKKRKAIRDKTVYIDKQLIRALDFQIVDTTFVIPDYSGNNRYWIINRNGLPILDRGYIPTEKGINNLYKQVLAQAWRSFIGYNSNNNIMVFVTQLGEVLEIQNLLEQKQYVWYGPNGEPLFNNQKNISIPKGIMGFSDVVVTDQHIYTVFHGTRFKDKRIAFQQGRKLEDGGYYIYVYDLKGNPLHKYILNRPVYGIHINEQTGTIIATCVNSEDPLLEFNMIRI